MELILSVVLLLLKPNPELLVVVPKTLILPDPVAVTLEFWTPTPNALLPVPHEMPHMEIVLEVVVTLVKLSIKIPQALSVPLAALPVIIILPVPTDEILEVETSETPLGLAPVLYVIPFIVSVP